MCIGLFYKKTPINAPLDPWGLLLHLIHSLLLDQEGQEVLPLHPFRLFLQFQVDRQDQEDRQDQGGQQGQEDRGDRSQGLLH